MRADQYASVSVRDDTQGGRFVPLAIARRSISREFFEHNPPSDMPDATRLFGDALPLALASWFSPERSVAGLEVIAQCFRAGDPLPDWAMFHRLVVASCLYAIDHNIFAAPSEATGRILALHSDRLLEVGAGCGYFSRAMRRCGLDIIASDINPGRLLQERCGIDPEIETMDGAMAVSACPERDVVLIMPRNGDLWFVDAVRQVQQPGRKLFVMPDSDRRAVSHPGFLRHDPAGAAAARELYELLDASFTEIGRIPLISVDRSDDPLLVFERH